MGNLEVSNLILVESVNDRAFVQKMMQKLSVDSTEAQNILPDAECDCMNGYTGLPKKLTEIKFDKYEKIGIIIDADNEGIAARIEYINNCLNAENIGSNITIEDINTPVHSINLTVTFIVYIMNVNGKGELETVLKEIKSKASDHADCLNAWQDCLSKKSINFAKKDFDKFWVSNYARFDTCSSNEQKQAGRKCSIAAAIDKEGIWDFDHSVLEDLKTFLKLFQ